MSPRRSAISLVCKGLLYCSAQLQCAGQSTPSLLMCPSFFVGEKPFDTIVDLVQDGLITLYMEANNVEEYLQTARRRTRHLTASSSSSYTSNTSTSLPRPHPHASTMPEPLMEEAEETTPSPPPRSPPPQSPPPQSSPPQSPPPQSPPPIPHREPSVPREERERSSSASSGVSDHGHAPANHGHASSMRRRARTYDEVEDVTLGTRTMGQMVGLANETDILAVD